MERKDYPFDPNSGNYVTAWASEGERAASEDDLNRWQSSHGGSVSRRQPSPVKKVASKSSTKKKSTASSSKGKSKGGSSSYTIKAGDNLGAIARKNNTTVAKIKAANGLKSDLIRAGKTLKIPK